MANAQHERINYVTPVGRITSGSVTEKRTQNHLGQPFAPEDQDHYIGLAIRKDQPGINEFIGMLYNHALASYGRVQGGQNIIQYIQGQQWPNGFHWKIKDGDKPNAKGNLDANAAGCWVLHMSTKFPFKACNAQNVEIDPATIKRGYYVDIAGSVAINGMMDATAGIYLNPSFIRLQAFGDEIVSGPSMEQAFANAGPVALPAGATLAPVAPVGTGLPGTGLPGVGLPQAAPVAPLPVQAAPLPATGQPILPTASPTNPVAFQPHPTFLTPGAPVAPTGLPGGLPF